MLVKAECVLADKREVLCSVCWCLIVQCSSAGTLGFGSGIGLGIFGVGNGEEQKEEGDQWKRNQAAAVGRNRHRQSSGGKGAPRVVVM